jgi:hypothetical protein
LNQVSKQETVFDLVYIVNKDLFFRNFKKPMAIQDKKNEQHYINNYNVSILGAIAN